MHIYIYVYMGFVFFISSKELGGRCEGRGGHNGGKTSKSFGNPPRLVRDIHKS